MKARKIPTSAPHNSPSPRATAPSRPGLHGHGAANAPRPARAGVNGSAGRSAPNGSRSTASQGKRAKAMSDDDKKSGGDDATTQSLDKVRDILFGQQVRESEKRFGRIEDRLQKELAEAREQFAKRMSAIEAFIKSEVDALSDRAKSEQSERTKADRELAAELADTAKTLEKKLSDLDGRTTDSLREIRKLILEQSKALRDEQQRNHAELTQTMNRALSELRHDKADRLGLAELFADVAMKLKGEGKGK